METLQKYSLFNLLNEYRKNKDDIDAYMKGQSIENYSHEYYNGDDANYAQMKCIMGLGIAQFIIVLVASLVFWIWATVELVRHWKKLPQWAQVFGVLGLLGVMGPGLTLLCVYIGLGQKNLAMQLGSVFLYKAGLIAMIIIANQKYQKCIKQAKSQQ